MLSAHSFNALLKTLEEPPPHVKFLLATTDPQKLPVTVLSRCLQFNLKRLPASLIAARLQHILGAEGVAFEPPAVQLLARSADGSLRDALSLLDQMLAFGGGRVTEADARSMLGTVDRQQVVRLVERVARARCARRCSRPSRPSTNSRPTTDSSSTKSLPDPESRAAPGRAWTCRGRSAPDRDAGRACRAHGRGRPAARLPVRDPRPPRPRASRRTRAPDSR